MLALFFKTNIMKILFLSFLVITACVVSCKPPIKGSGKIITDTAKVGKFSAIKSSSSIDVEVYYAETQKVEVSADDNVIDLVEVSVSSETLKIGYEDNVSLMNAHVTVKVYTPSIKQLTATSSSSIEVKSLGDTQMDLELNANSSADIKLTVNAHTVKASASSSSEIKIKGAAVNFVADANSSADINAKDLMAKEVTATASSSSNIKVFAMEKFTASANSSADIDNYGPAKGTISKSSSGSVNNKGN